MDYSSHNEWMQLSTNNIIFVENLIIECLAILCSKSDIDESNESYDDRAIRNSIHVVSSMILKEMYFFTSFIGKTKLYYQSIFHV